MTREEELEYAVERLESALNRLEELSETLGLLALTFRRLLPVGKPDFRKPDFDYRTGMPPDG
jgi:hypothetical protein